MSGKCFRLLLQVLRGRKGRADLPVAPHLLLVCRSSETRRPPWSSALELPAGPLPPSHRERGSEQGAKPGQVSHLVSWEAHLAKAQHGLFLRGAREAEIWRGPDV